MAIDKSSSLFDKYCKFMPYDIDLNVSNAVNVSKVIKFKSLRGMPFTSQQNSYSCGPLTQLIYEVSSRYGYKYETSMRFVISYQLIFILFSLRNIQQGSPLWIYGAIISGELDILLHPITKSYIDIIGFDSSAKLSRFVGIISESHFLSKANLGECAKFSYLRSFDTNVWLLTIFILIIISFISQLKVMSISQFTATLWRYASVLFSEPIERLFFKKLQQKLSNRIVLCVWLLSCTILLSSFSGVLRGFFITRIPHIVIDSWEDLYAIKNMRIYSQSISFLSNYVSESKSEMAIEFEKRIDMFETGINSTTAKIMLKDVYRGTHVMEWTKDRLEIDIPTYAQSNLKGLHISKHGGGEQPYFVVMSPTIDAQTENVVNKM